MAPDEDRPTEEARPGLPVRELLADCAAHLGLRLVAGEKGLDRRVHEPRVQKASLAVTGHIDSVRRGRIQVLGSAELSYLASRTPRKRQAIIRKLCRAAPLTCFVVTGARPSPAELTEEAEESSVAVLTTSRSSAACIEGLEGFLDERLGPRTSVHGGLIDVHGLGVLLLGESGIGKSECALDLITRGHRLVCDDVVEIRAVDSSVLVGSGPALSGHHMEIRGLGILNIADLFGSSAIRRRKHIELVVLMERWRAGQSYDLLGIDEATYAILGVELPSVRLPAAPGRNLAMLIEVSARNQLLKVRGAHSARRFIDGITRAQGQGDGPDSDPARPGSDDPEQSS